MLRESGSTRVMAGPPGSGGTDSVLRAVLATVAGQYELLGEMGRGVAGTVMYLARELDSSDLVVLRLDPAPSGDGSVLSVMRELDASVPGSTVACPQCGANAVAWGRFCPACGTDLAAEEGEGEAASTGGESSSISEGAQQAAAADYDIIGSIARAGGKHAGAVQFGRDLATGELVALAAFPARSASAGDGTRLSPAFRVLQTLRPVTAASAVAATPELPPESELPPPRAQPTPHRAAPQEVLIPGDDLSSPEDRLPPRPLRRTPRWWIAPAALGAAVVVALAAFVKSRALQPDGTDARLGSGGMGVTMASAAPAAVASPAAHVDSGHIRIASQLPPDATVTIDGASLSSESVSLLPGEYMLAASAPGYVGVSERLTLEPGQTLVWMPALTAAATEAAPAKQNPKAPPPASSRPEPAKRSAVAAERDTPVVAVADPPASSCQSAFNAKDWGAAARLCAAEARNGVVASQRNLGVMFDRGVGVPRDPAQGADWLRRAAEAGSRDAAYQLGAMYENGRGVEKDPARAVSWYSKAALLGDRESQVKVGKAYEQGLGVAADMGEALTWYRKAAGQGDAWAQNYIGFLYGNGKGVRHDDVEALRWFRQAAASGNAQAEYNVGFMYANGRGVGRSEADALRWYKQAARHGYDEAVKELQRRGIKP